MLRGTCDAKRFGNHEIKGLPRDQLKELRLGTRGKEQVVEKRSEGGEACETVDAKKFENEELAFLVGGVGEGGDRDRVAWGVL